MDTETKSALRTGIRGHNPPPGGRGSARLRLGLHAELSTAEGRCPGPRERAPQAGSPELVIETEQQAHF